MLLLPAAGMARPMPAASAALRGRTATSGIKRMTNLLATNKRFDRVGLDQVRAQSSSRFESIAENRVAGAASKRALEFIRTEIHRAKVVRDGLQIDDAWFAVEIEWRCKLGAVDGRGIDTERCRQEVVIAMCSVGEGGFTLVY